MHLHTIARTATLCWWLAFNGAIILGLYGCYANAEHMAMMQNGNTTAFLAHQLYHTLIYCLAVTVPYSAGMAAISAWEYIHRHPH